jgi:hypothetical protein
MKEKIASFLDTLEEQHKVEILFACESGSRAWGFPSPDSDYDIRFIYRHPSSSYISIFEPRGNITILDGLIDGSGWDLLKALRLGAKSNVSLFEWLQSPVKYRETSNFEADLWEALLPCFQPRSAIHHYLGIASSTLHRNFKSEQVLLKKYFYVLRPLFCARYITQHQRPAPTEFRPLLRFMEGEEEIEKIIHGLLEEKADAEEGATVKRNAQLDQFVEQELAQLLTIAKSMPKVKVDTSRLDSFYRQTLNVRL